MRAGKVTPRCALLLDRRSDQSGSFSHSLDRGGSCRCVGTKRCHHSPRGAKGETGVCNYSLREPFFCCRFRSRTPGPPPFSSMNSTPADSNARRIAKSLALVSAVKDVTYDFPAGGATLETMAKNVVMQFGVGNSQKCLPSPQGISQCSQWQLEDGSYMRLGVDAYQRNMLLYLSTPKWITSLEEQAFEKEQGRIPPRKF
jgi:hypothetical protein